jgi:hypothetical protein
VKSVFLYWLAKINVSQNAALSAISIVERSLRQSVNKILHFLQFGWYGLEVSKHKTCLPPKHIGDKIFELV